MVVPNSAGIAPNGWAALNTCPPVPGLGLCLCPAGIVHRATWRGGCVAVKRVQPHSRDQGTNFVREVEALAQLRHPHVMQLYAACARPPSDFWLICELLSGGSLAVWLYGGPGARRLPARSLSDRLKMALDVARGMQVSWPCGCCTCWGRFGQQNVKTLKSRRHLRTAMARKDCHTHCIASPAPPAAGAGGAHAPDPAPRPQAQQRVHRLHRHSKDRRSAFWAAAGVRWGGLPLGVAPGQAVQAPF